MLAKMTAALALSMVAGLTVWTFAAGPPTRNAAEQARHSLWVQADAIPGRTLGDVHSTEAGADPNPKVQAYCSKIDGKADDKAMFPEAVVREMVRDAIGTCRALHYL